MPGCSVASEAALPELVQDPVFDALRSRGFRGTPILQHRALSWHRLQPGTVVAAILVACLLDAALLWLADPIGRAWHDIMEFWLAPLASGEPVALARRVVLPDVGMLIPTVVLGAGAPTGLQWLYALLATIVLFLGTFLLPHRARPAAYLLRLVALVQFSAQLYFYVTPGRFPYSLREHVTTLSSGMFLLMLLVPWVHALAYYPFDHRWSRKIALTALTLGFFFVYTPLVLALHAWIIWSGSLLFQPLLYIIFGYPMAVFLFVCLYGWGMSWRE